MNVPNILTIFRLFLVPVFILLFFSGVDNSLLYSIGIFLIAGFTDILDGYIARRFKLITDWGKVLDPLADKLMLLTVLACLTVADYIPVWVLVIILAKETFMIGFASILYTKGTIIPSNIIGKISTFLFYLSIFVFSFNESLGIYLIYISVLTAVFALVNYSMIYFSNHKGAIKK